MKEIVVESKKHGIHKILLDDDDYEVLSKYKWTVCKGTNTFYAQRREYYRLVLMHRVILELSNSIAQVDHRDRNGLNNQRHNLRVATKSQNMANVQSRKNSFSKYLGVSWCKHKERWRARVTKDYKETMVGYFKNEIDAAIAYNNAAKKIHGDFANLNEI